MDHGKLCITVQKRQNQQRLKENALFGLQDEAIPILLSTWKSLVERTESFCKNLGTVASLTYKQ